MVAQPVRTSTELCRRCFHLGQGCPFPWWQHPTSISVLSVLMDYLIQSFHFASDFLSRSQGQPVPLNLNLRKWVIDEDTPAFFGQGTA